MTANATAASNTDGSGPAAVANDDPFAEQVATHHERAAEHERRAVESFERSDTDGFVSQWASGISAQKERLAADIAANGGNAEFPALHQLNDDGTVGPRVAAKLIDGRYGPSWAFCDQEDRFTGDFVSAFPKRDATMDKKGFVEIQEEAPAYADTWAPAGATGLSGATQVQVIAKRKDAGYPNDAVHVDKHGNPLPPPATNS